MSPKDFRRIALGMKGAIESAHMGHPDFRVEGRIFATLHSDDQWGMVKLSPEQQQEFVGEIPQRSCRKKVCGDARAARAYGWIPWMRTRSERRSHSRGRTPSTKWLFDGPHPSEQSGRFGPRANAKSQCLKCGTGFMGSPRPGG
jgi:hypothetical protein